MKPHKFYEFTIAFKYLIPKRKSLSTSLISLMSVFVISLVVWLILVFLSVTAGIEKNWIYKLTALNAPLRILPTNSYHSSYYYQIDRISSKSNFACKTISEKACSEFLDPYLPGEDMEIPHFWPKPEMNKGKRIDIVKELYSILKKRNDLIFDDFELSGALMKLDLFRTMKSENLYLDEERISSLSQMSYILSLAGKNPNLSSLNVEITPNDLNNLLTYIERTNNDAKDTVDRNVLHRFFDNVKIDKLISQKGFIIPHSFLAKKSFEGYYSFESSSIILSQDPKTKFVGFEKGTIYFEESPIFKTEENRTIDLSQDIIVLSNEPIIFQASLFEPSLENLKRINDIEFKITGTLQGKELSGKLSYNNLKIFEARPKTDFVTPPSYEPFWIYKADNQYFLPKTDAAAVLIPKSFKESGVLIGDQGHFSFATRTIASDQEEQIPIYVAGFYDPGILSIGNRCILVDKNVTKTIFASNSSFMPDNVPPNGIFIWNDDLTKIDKLKEELTEDLAKDNLQKYWKVETYKEYEFAKDLMQQFQSDKLLFTLIAIIIILVACSNIISLLMLLVNDKKKEIATLQAMGATKMSIAIIFAICGITMGVISSLLGTFGAILTLKHLDLLVNFLSLIQGHAAFNSAFFGEKLPNTLSIEALLFIIIVTPLISLLAGIIPAVKSCKLAPSQVLRSD